MLLVPVSNTRTVELVRHKQPERRAMHCHDPCVMNQMGQIVPNMIGVGPRGVDAGADSSPDYMTCMGRTGWPA